MFVIVASNEHVRPEHVPVSVRTVQDMAAEQAMTEGVSE